MEVAPPVVAKGADLCPGNRQIWIQHPQIDQEHIFLSCHSVGPTKLIFQMSYDFWPAAYIVKNPLFN